MAQTDFFKSAEKQPHPQRSRDIIAKYPEVANLVGRNSNTFWILLVVVAVQITIAIYMGSFSNGKWWISLIVAYTVGAFANQAMYVVIHEATHNLIFKNRTYNRLCGIMADLVNVVPGAMGFSIYHLKHHAHMGDYINDADFPSRWEAKLVGNATWKKILWLALFPVFQVFRTFRMKHINTWSKWVKINMLIVFTFDILMVYFFGWNSVVYLLASMMFALGLHPLGARWVQEHYTTDGGQETGSYYGYLNKIVLNVGYHNEHHDFPGIPWNNLPKLRAMAPEFYNTITYHSSWTKLFFEFLFSPSYSLFSRVEREPGETTLAVGKTSGKN